MQIQRERPEPADETAPLKKSELVRHSFDIVLQDLITFHFLTNILANILTNFLTENLSFFESIQLFSNDSTFVKGFDFYNRMLV